MKKILIICICLLFLYGCTEDNNYILKPTSFTLLVTEPPDSSKVDKVSEVIIKGTWDSIPNFSDILIYAIVKSPGDSLYPYYAFPLNENHTWKTSLWLGQKTDKSGSEFDVFFCAVLLQDTVRLEKYHVPEKTWIKSMGISIPDYCTVLAQRSFLIK